MNETSTADAGGWSPQSGTADAERVLCWANRLVAGVFAFTAVGSVAALPWPGKAGAPAACGLDRVLAACDSDKTFESLIRTALDESQRDFEAEYDDQFRPAFDTSSFGSFDSRSFQFQPYDSSTFQSSRGR
jgi:hypothetical protein